MDAGLLRPDGERRGEEASGYYSEECSSVHREPPPDRPSRRDRAEGRPSGLTLPQRRAVWLGLLLPIQALAHEVLPLIPGAREAIAKARISDGAHAVRGSRAPSSQGSRPCSRSVQPHRFGYLLEVSGVGRS
jgi:hypothetical protein